MKYLIKSSMKYLRIIDYERWQSPTNFQLQMYYDQYSFNSISIGLSMICEYDYLEPIIKPYVRPGQNL